MAVREKPVSGAVREKVLSNLIHRNIISESVRDKVIVTKEVRDGEEEHEEEESGEEEKPVSEAVRVKVNSSGEEESGEVNSSGEEESGEEGSGDSSDEEESVEFYYIRIEPDPETLKNIEAVKHLMAVQYSKYPQVFDDDDALDDLLTSLKRMSK